MSTPIVSTLMTVVTAEEFGTHIPMREKGLAAYYVTTEINGLGTVDLLVDTGSGYSIINEDTLTVLMQQQRADYIKDLEGKLADGRRIVMPLYSIHGINIGGMCALENIEVAVFPGKTRQILGLSALRQASPFIFSLNPPQLILSHCMSDLADAQVEVTVPSEPPLEAVTQANAAPPS